MNEAPEFYAKDRAAWRKWLIENHETATAVWLVYDKAPNRTLEWSDIVQEELCFGWIDGRAGSVSDTQSKIYISKRKPKGTWSKINKEFVETLTTQGLIMSAGQAAIDIAKQNGAWDALNKSDALEMPEELIAAFANDSKAKAFYDSMSPSSKKLILAWIYSAKRDETKLARIEQTATLAAKGIKAHH